MAIGIGVTLLRQRLLVSAEISWSVTARKAAISQGSRRGGISVLGGAFLNHFWFCLSLGLLFVCLSVLGLYLLHSSLAGRGRLNPSRYCLGEESHTPSTSSLPSQSFFDEPLLPAYLSTLFGLAPYMHLLQDFICENYIL